MNAAAGREGGSHHGCCQCTSIANNKQAESACDFTQQDQQGQQQQQQRHHSRQFGKGSKRTTAAVSAAHCSLVLDVCSLGQRTSSLFCHCCEHAVCFDSCGCVYIAVLHAGLHGIGCAVQQRDFVMHAGQCVTKVLLVCYGVLAKKAALPERVHAHTKGARLNTQLPTALLCPA